MRRVLLTAAAALLTLLTIGTAAATAAPANDNFASATPITGNGGTFQGTTIGAGSEVGEAAPSGAINSVWYSYTPTFSGRVVFNLCTTDYDSYMALYTGASVSGLSSVTSNDDSPLNCDNEHLNSSYFSFVVTSGTTYHLLVDGFGVKTGNFTLLVDNGSIAGSGVSPLDGALSFGSTTVGTLGATSYAHFTNFTGALTTPTALTAVDMTPGDGGAHDFVIANTTCTRAIPAGDSCWAQVRFAPSATGARSAALLLYYSSTSNGTLLSGTGTAAVAAQGPEGPAGPAGPAGASTVPLGVALGLDRFVGRATKALTIRYVTTKAAGIKLQLLQGKKIKATYSGSAKAAGRNVFTIKKLPAKGTYSLRITASSGAAVVADSAKLIVTK